LIFVVGAVVAALVFKPGDLTALGSELPIASADTELDEAARSHVYRVRVACR
jgi:hypothetical protein